MYPFRFIYLVIGILLLSINTATAQTKPVVKYDSVIIKTITPPQAKEHEVSEEVDLSFAKTKENNDISAWDRFINWLLNSLFGKTDRDGRITLQWIFIWVFVIAGVLLAVWLFRKSEFGSFLKGNTKQSEFNFSDVDEDMNGIDFHKKIEQAKAETDYRLAIRWLYLKQLFLLNEKNQIVWQPYKTNMDYTNELLKSNHKQAFKDISKIYEYVWYGEYSVDQKAFHNLELQFKQFESAISV